LEKPVLSAGFFVLPPSVTTRVGFADISLRHLPPSGALRAEGGRELSDAAGRPAASLPGSRFLNNPEVSSRAEWGRSAKGPVDLSPAERGSRSTKFPIHCRARNSTPGRSCLMV